MVFSSGVFLLVFLPITFIVNLFLSTKQSNIWLLIASLLFYAWGEPFFVFLMILSIILNWLVGMGIGKSEGKLKRLILTLGIVFDLGFLGYYKYAGFVVSLLNRIVHHEIMSVPQIALPIGISFFYFSSYFIHCGCI